MMIFNKKGAEKILSIYWFTILIIVVVGIYAMVSLYYSHPYDIRELETSLLTNKVADCISYNGELRQGVFNESKESNGALSDSFKNNFLNTCKITFNVEEVYGWRNTLQYYVEINFYDINLNSLGSVVEGNNNLKELCIATKKQDYTKMPKCENKRFYSLYKNKPVLIDIFSAVRKTEKNVK